MPDDFSAHATGLTSPGKRTVAVTPSDGVDLAKQPRGIVGETDGLVKMTYDDGSTDTVPLAGKIIHPLRPVRIWATGTTMTNIHAVY